MKSINVNKNQPRIFRVLTTCVIHAQDVYKKSYDCIYTVGSYVSIYTDCTLHTQWRKQNLYT